MMKTGLLPTRLRMPWKDYGKAAASIFSWLTLLGGRDPIPAGIAIAGEGSTVGYGPAAGRSGESAGGKLPRNAG